MAMTDEQIQEYVNKSIEAGINAAIPQIIQAMTTAMNNSSASAQTNGNPGNTILIQNPQAQNGYGSMTMDQIMSLPPELRNAIFGIAMKNSESDVDRLNNKVDQLADALTMYMWQNSQNNNKHHSTGHKILKYGGIAALVGGGVYGVHKLTHKNDGAKYEALANAAVSIAEMKYGGNKI